MLRILSKSLDLSENVFAFLAGVLLLISILSVAFEVASRFLFSRSYAIIGELNAYILLFVTFLAAAWLLRQNGHIVVDLLDRVLPIGPLKIMNVLVILVGLIVTGFLVWYGTVMTIDAYTRNLLSTTIVRFPQVYVLAVIPLGSLLLFLEFIRKGYRLAVGAEAHRSQSTPMAE